MAKIVEKQAGLPGSPAIPLLSWRAYALPFARDPLVYMLGLYRKYGPAVTLAQGSTKYVFAFGPEFNRLLLSNPDLFHTPSVEEGTLPFKSPVGSAAERMSTGILLSNGATHKRLRRLILPALHRKRVEAYRDEMVELTEKRIAGWKSDQVVDILKEMRQLTLSVAVKTLLGLDPEKSGENTRLLMDLWVRLSFHPLTILFPYNLPGLPYRRFVKVSEAAEKELLALIHEKRRQLTDKGDVLSMLMLSEDEDGSKMSDEELVGQITGLFVAGHETTANALTWTLLLLSQTPRVLEEVREELQARLGGSAPTIEQLPDLSLLERVLKETMRLLPPVLWSQRTGVEDFELGPYSLQRGTNVLYSPAITHRMPELFSEPGKFKPARWENINPTIYEYLPFGAGPRMCVGATFAMTEMKIVLALLLKRFSFNPPPGTTVNRTGLTICTPRGSLPMQLSPAGNRASVSAALKGNLLKVVEF